MNKKFTKTKHAQVFLYLNINKRPMGHVVHMINSPSIKAFAQSNGYAIKLREKCM